MRASVANGRLASRVLKNTLCGGYRGSSDPLDKEQPWDFPGKIATAGRPRTLHRKSTRQQAVVFQQPARAYPSHMRTVLLLFLAVALAAAEPAPEWPQFRGPQRNGISTETGWSHSWPAEGPK